MLAVPLRAQEPEGARARVVSVARNESRDGPRWSLLCEEAPVDEVLRALARKSGLALEGAELVPVGATATVQLQRRSLEQVLDFVLGSQGLRYELVRGTLRLLPATSDPAELLRLAQDAWGRVEADGEPRASAKARLARGNLLEVRGDLEAAYHVYADLAEDQASDEAAEAMYRAGRILQRLGHWAEAAQHFRTLASLEGAESLRSKARLELARASIELGDAPSALHVLNYLEANYETDDPVELCERRLVRARALNATHEYVEALRVLGAGEIAADADTRERSLAILAEAFQGLGFEVEAARAWLIFAREAARGEQSERAFARAAELSLEGGDELGTLFICREAARHGADEGLGALAHRARVRLGLEEEEPPSTIEERLTRAEELLARRQVVEAAEILEGLYLARGTLSEPDQARVVAGWARVLLVRKGLEAAIELLSRGRDSLQDPDAARTLDLAAAALFESQDRFEDAAEAYRGNY